MQAGTDADVSSLLPTWGGTSGRAVSHPWLQFLPDALIPEFR